MPDTAGASLLDELDSPLEIVPAMNLEPGQFPAVRAERDNRRNEEGWLASGWRVLVLSSQRKPGISASLTARPRVAQLHGCQLTPKPNPEPSARIRKSAADLTQL